MKTLLDTPDAIVREGKPQLGQFRTPFRNLNLLDADVFGAFGPLSKPLKKFRLKEWEHIGVAHEDIYFGLLVFDAKYMGTSFFYVYNRKTGDFFEYERIVPLGAGIKLSRELWDETAFFHHAGHNVEIHNHLEAGKIEFEFKIDSRGGKPAVEGRFSLLEDPSAYTPLIVSLPLGDNKVMYSHKAVRPVLGTINVDGKSFDLKPGRDYGLLDVHKAFYPYYTWWKWATFGFVDPKGRLIGLNLTRNLIGDSDQWNENGLWVDGTLSLLPAAEFEFDENKILQPWRVRTRDDRVNLEFKPVGERKGKVSTGVIMSDYHQPFGTFSGFAVDDAGERHEIKDAFGITELHRAKF